jgi:hypothetical protein
VSSKSYRRDMGRWVDQAERLRADEETSQQCRNQETSQQMSVDATLTTRAGTYGKFQRNAAISQSLKYVARSSDNWDRLEGDQQESLDQMFSKIGRLLTGDPNHYDSWHDLAGYATLVAERLNGNSR